MNFKNILIIKLSAIGDVIHALPVAAALKEADPSVRVTWIVERPAYDLLADHPFIDQVIVFDKAKFKTGHGFFHELNALAGELRQYRFDLALDLQGLLKSAVLSWLSGAPTKLVYCNARELSDWIGKRVCGDHRNGHVVERYLDVARYLGCDVNRVNFGIHITEDEAEKAISKAQEYGLDLGKPYIILAPGANWPNKCWPAIRFAELADRLALEGITPVVVGGPKEKPLFDEIAKHMKTEPVNLVGRTTLKELAYVIQRARAFVGGDTGPMHLAAAMGTKVVALFGPTDPKRNGPYGEEHEVLTVERECQGCWERRCSMNFDCLSAIDVDEVVLSLENTLARF
jgi:heptosyltransferase-1